MDPYIGEIRLFAGSFAPVGWALCNGQELDIRAHQSLYSVIGTTYGGDGVRTFRLPDFRGRAPAAAPFPPAATEPEQDGAAAPAAYVHINYMISLHGVYPDR